MTLLAPAMLWSLVALVPLTAIYFLNVRPRRKFTTAYFLWERIFQEQRASSLFQRLRDVWSLLLVLLAAAAICLALAQPQWSDQRQDLLIVVDSSASMAARDGGDTRLAAAKDLARSIVEGLNGTQRAAVATIGRDLVYRSHLTDNPRELLDAIEAIEAAPEPVSDQAIAELAGAGSGWQRARRVLLVSDGGFKADQLGRAVELFKVGAAVDNVGLVAADLAYLPDAGNRLSVYFQFASSFNEPKTCDLTLSHVDEDGVQQLFKVIPLELAPGLNPPERFVMDEAPAGRWLARVDVDDALASDNTAWLAARKPPPVRVAVESDDRFFLENSVVAFSTGDDFLSLVADNPEVVIAKSAVPAANLSIIFLPEGEAPWWTDLGDDVEVAAPRVLLANHPVLRHLDAATIPFVGARRLAAPPGAQVLVADESGLPLIYAIRREGRSAIVANLDPVASDFYFSAWFPVLVHAAVTHLVGREAQLAASFRPGETVPAVGAREGETVKLLGPVHETGDDGAAVKSAATPPTREVAATDVRLPAALGFYELETAAGSTPLAASLLSAQETLANSSAADTRQPIAAGSSPVRWLTLVALVVLTGESVLYHRRKVG